MWLTASTQHGSRALPLSYPAFAAITADTATFQTAAAFAGAEVQLADGGEPIRLRGEIVSNGYWRTLGTPLAIGRALRRRRTCLRAQPRGRSPS